MQLLLLLLFTCFQQSLHQSTSSQPKIGCIKYTGSTCTQLCNLGQYDCSRQPIICEFGYFNYNSTCVQCPKQDYNDDFVIYCGDCLEQSQTWQNSRVCSFDFVIESSNPQTGTYIKRINDYTELYLIIEALTQPVWSGAISRVSQRQYQVLICSGCGNICTPSSTECNAITNTIDTTITGVTCLDSYYFNNGVCASCQKNCLKCTDNQQCTECAAGFDLKNDCKACMDGCQQCYDGQCFECTSPTIISLDRSYCQSCNDNCLRCEYICYSDSCTYKYITRNNIKPDSNDQSQYVLRCRQCDNGNVISYNGEDCLQCQITNCVACYYTITASNGDVRSTLDIDFVPQVDGETSSKQLCYVCEFGYTLDGSFEHCVTNPPAVTVTNCLLYGRDCVTCNKDQILDIDLNSCLSATCSNYITNCLYCYQYKNPDNIEIIDSLNVKSYSQEEVLFQCTQCDDGYYPDFFTGNCLECPNRCSTCWQYSPTYNFTLYNQIPKPTQFRYSYFNDQPILVQCTQCKAGFTLYGNECLGCTVNCVVPLTSTTQQRACLFKSTYAVCSQCFEPFYQRSLTQDQSECQECPNQCLACYDRNISTSPNPYFDPLSSWLQKYSRICYKIQPLTLDSTYVHFSTDLNMPIICNSQQPCYHSTTIDVTLYCDSNDFKNSIAAGQSTMYNYDLSVFYALKSENVAVIQFYDLETVQLYTQMNQQPLQELFLNIHIQGAGTDNTCTFSKSTTILTQFHQNIFSLTNFTISITSSNTLKLYVNGDFNLSNYPNIKISNIFMYSYESDFAFIFGSLKSLQIVNLQFNKQSQVLFNFLLSNITTILINDTEFNNFNESDVISIAYSNQITLNSVLFDSVELTNQQFIILDPPTYITITDLQIKSSLFSNFAFLQDPDLNSDCVGYTDIKNLLIQNSIFNNSQFFSSRNSQYFQIFYFQLLNNIIYDSIIFKSNQFDVLDVIAYKNTFSKNAYLFLSCEETSDSQIDYLSQSSFQGINLTNNSCENTLIDLTTPFNSLSTLTNISITSLYIDQIQTVIDGTALIQIKNVGSVIVTGLVIKNLLLITGLQVMTFTYAQVNIFECASPDTDTQLPVEFDCFPSKKVNSHCLHFEDFDRGVYLNNGVIKKQLEIDSSMIYIKSYEFLDKDTYSSSASQDENTFFYGYDTELIIIKNIKFYNNTLGAYYPQIDFALITIESAQNQAIKIKNLEFIGNHLHQSPSSVNIFTATCLFINSPLANFQISDSTFYDNRATGSAYGLIRLTVENLTMSNLSFTKTNQVTSKYADILEPHNLFSSNETEEMQNILQYFEVLSVGSNIYVDCDDISISDTVIGDSNGIDGAGMYIVGSDQLKISLVNITMYNIICSLEHDTMGCGIFIESSLSSLTLTIDQLSMHKLISYQAAAIHIQSESSTITVVIKNSIFQQCQALHQQVFYFQQQTINSNIPIFVFQNCTIFDNHFDNYILNLFSKQSSLNFDEEIVNQINSLIYIDYGTITLIDCQIYDISLTTLFNFQNILILNMNNVKITNIVIGLQTLISLNFNQESGHANINQLFISNVTEYAYWTTSQLAALSIDSDFSNSIQESLDEQSCTDRVEYYPKNNIYQISFDVSTVDANYIDRNPAESSDLDSYIYFTEYTDMKVIKKLYSEHIIDFGIETYPALFTLPILDFYGDETNETDINNPSHTIYLNKLIVQSVSCVNCQNGLFYFPEISKIGNLSVQILEVQFMNNDVGYFGCFNFLGSSRDAIDYTTVYTIMIKDSQFISNTAIIGPALGIVSISTYIQDSIFQDNVASKTGGALYFQGSEQIILYIKDLVVQGNSADIGSGLFVQGYFLPDDTQYPGNNGRSINEEIPQHLSISMVDDVILPTTPDDQYSDTITNFLTLPSGQKISTYKLYSDATQEQVPYDWQFRVIHLDKYYRRILTGQTSDYCEISGRMLDSTESNHTQTFLTNYTSPQSANFQSEDYNLDDLIITFDPYLPSNYYLQLQFYCTSIQIPQGDYPYTLDSSNYYLYLNVNTLQCQLGESYYSQKCTACSSDTYALKRNQPVCSNIAVDSMEEVTPIRIKLYSGYWRYDSDVVESCYNLASNCNGGWIPGDASCYTGHIGALCESCDIYGIRGDQYSISAKYKCGACQDTQTTNSLTIVAICVFTLLQMILSVKGNYQMLENFIREQVLQSMGIRINQNEANLSILLKLMTNYFQIISALGTFRISIPTNLVSSIEVVSNPTQSMAYSLDCFLIDLSFVSILYFRMIWALLMPLLYLSIFFFGYGIGVCVKLLPGKIGIIYTTLIYMFIYLQPTLIAGFIALLSSRTLGGTEFVQSDVQFLYSTEEHYFWILTFAGPNLICWGAIFPYLFMHQVRKNYNTLQTIATRRKFGYFYNEYTQHAYLWEFVKIFEKQFVLMALTYYEDVIIIKGLIVFLIVFVYGILSFEFSPYQSRRLNYIDQVSSAVCVISLCLGVLIKASQSENIYYLQIIMFLIIGAINILFVFILIYEVFRGYLNKFQEHVDKLRDKINEKYPSISQNRPWLRRFLINKGELKKRAKNLWSYLRYETRKGIARRRTDKTLPLFFPKLVSQESEKEDNSRIESKANSRLSVIDINHEEIMNLANNISSVLAKTPEIHKVYPLDKIKGGDSLAKLKKGKLL